MSKIAEKKALEAYPDATLEECHGDIKMMNYCNNDNSSLREGFIKGYDQAMQDFLEWLKDCSTFTYSNGYKRIDDDLYNKLVEDFKNYMEKEL